MYSSADFSSKNLKCNTQSSALASSQYVAVAQRRLSCSQAGYGHAVGRAADKVQADFMTKLDRAGVAGMFAADADQKLRTCGAAAGDSQDLEGVIASETARWSRFVIENKLKER